MSLSFVRVGGIGLVAAREKVRQAERDSRESLAASEAATSRAGWSATWYLCEVPTELPGWVTDDVASVLEEVKEWRGTTATERWRLAEACARDAMWAARASGMPRRILDQVDPLPESTLRALERLRRASGWGHEHR